MFGRLQQEEAELTRLAACACKSAYSKGRRFWEEECDFRTKFQRDRDRIIHSKAFRRLKHKTQVFIAPECDHYRTRLTHTLEVAQIARTIARLLQLNEDLVEAISLGHDLGHTPFGHAGERILNSLVPGGFIHNDQSLRVVDYLEPYKIAGAGLNLTWEVRDGIRNHTGPGSPSTLEGAVVHLADRIAYINHDIDDAIRAGILHPADLPSELLAIVGDNHALRISRMIQDIVNSSCISRGDEKKEIKMSRELGEATAELRDFLFARVYLRAKALAEEERVRELLTLLFQYYLQNPEELPDPPQRRPEGVPGYPRQHPEEFGGFPRQHPGEVADSPQKTSPLQEECLERRVADYLAGMTDQYAIFVFQKKIIRGS